MSKSEQRDTLLSIAQKIVPSRGHVSKPDHYYEKYEQFFCRYDAPVVFEIGIYRGESTWVFSKYLRKCHVVGIDADLHNLEIGVLPNVSIERADQSDRVRMTEIIEKYAPRGIDIVIDDASHIGHLSKATFEILFPKVVSGGLYVVEDWGTGYWSDWSDGSTYEEYQTSAVHPGKMPKRIPSHDFGMVGFIKHLVDVAGQSDNRPVFSEAPTLPPTPVKGMHIFPGTVIIEKL